jgi:2'-5' RNA ligase
MVQSVELLLDDAGDEAVRQEWEVLRAHGLPSQGRIAAVSNRPHITVGVARDHALDPDAEDALAQAAARLADELPTMVLLSGLVIFPGHRAVLARSVAPTTALIRVQEWFAGVLASFGPVAETLRPGRWTPHITLARGLSGPELGAAVELVGRQHIDTAVGAVRRWDGAAHREWIIAGAGPDERSTRGSIP